MSDTLLDKNKIWQQIDDEKENMLQLWQELVNVDCGSGNKAVCGMDCARYSTGYCTCKGTVDCPLLRAR